MQEEEKRFTCCGCDDGMTRRDFVKAAGGAAVAAGLLTTPRLASAAPTPKSPAETTVKRLYDSLSSEQRKIICLPFDHEKRTEISANWAITEPSIGSDFYSDDQRKLINEVLRGVSSEEGYEKFHRQMKDDLDGGFGDYHVAIFGKPGAGKSEWEMTGRHLTIRADGNSVDNMAFGGPIVYGHGKEDPKKNLYHYQTKKANEVFTALDPKQREASLLSEAPEEDHVPLQGSTGKFAGVAVADLSSDQKELVESVIKVILAPYRKADVDEVLAVLKAGGGLEQLRMAFYSEDDLNNDAVWDIWRVEGPTFVWHFRGAPHVHTYVHIGTKTTP